MSMGNRSITWKKNIILIRQSINRTFTIYSMMIKGQMHHHDDLGSKCAYTCHRSNKPTRKSVLLSTPQIWLMKVSKKTGLSLGIEADITDHGTHLSPILIGREISVAVTSSH